MHGPSQNWITLFPGVRRRRLVATERLYQMIVQLDQGAEVPLHQHSQEQVSLVISGRLRFQIGAETIEAGTGDALAIPADAPHQVWVLERSVVIDTFSPPRADYLQADGDTQ
jgi:quercetin dioxygenase-like cupin family protein